MSKSGTYVEELRNKTQVIRELTRAGEMPANKRFPLILFSAVEYAVAFDDHYEEEKSIALEKGTDPIPRFKDAKLLEQLANLILHEDITDAGRWKSRNAEYPFLSDTQLARRQSGVHQRNDGLNLGETDFESAEYFGSDGRNYSLPVRRKFSIHEGIKADAAVKSRNKERAKKYRDFTKTQPVNTFYVGEILT